jgi:hypothetical protein
MSWAGLRCRTDSPAWRRGPPGKPHLCNACGVRYLGKGHLNGYMPGSKARGTPRTQRALCTTCCSCMRSCAELRCRRKGGDKQLLQQWRALLAARVSALHLGSACLGLVPLVPGGLRAQPAASAW